MALAERGMCRVGRSIEVEWHAQCEG